MQERQWIRDHCVITSLPPAPIATKHPYVTLLLVLDVCCRMFSSTLLVSGRWARNCYHISASMSGLLLGIMVFHHISIITQYMSTIIIRACCEKNTRKQHTNKKQRVPQRMHPNHDHPNHDHPTVITDVQQGSCRAHDSQRVCLCIQHPFVQRHHV